MIWCAGTCILLSQFGAWGAWRVNRMYTWIVQGSDYVEFILIRILEVILIPIRILQAIAGGPGTYGTTID